MSMYIDADTLVKRLKHSPLFLGTNMQFKDGVIDLVKRQPTADVVEVRHGYWEQNPFFKSIYYCSECGRHIEDGSNTNDPTEHFPYCHCGAKMDGEGRTKNAT